MKLLRVPPASTKYGISGYTLYGWHSRGKFPSLFVKIGKILFLDERELERIARESKGNLQAEQR